MAEVGDEVVQNVEEIVLSPLENAFIGSKSYMDFLSQMVRRIDMKLTKNKHDQRTLKRKRKILKDHDAVPPEMLKFFDRSRFCPPYFRDSFGMAPESNDEQRRRLADGVFDVMVSEESPWMEGDLSRLKRGVRNSLIQVHALPCISRRDLFKEKLRNRRVEASDVDIKHWEEIVASMDRRIAYLKQIDSRVLFRGDYREVDWLALSNITFRNTRTARQLRQKWVNEQCPEWSQQDWTVEEWRQLHKIALNPSMLGSLDWDMVADQLNTDRHPIQCFTKVRLIVEDITNIYPWSNKDDFRLLTVTALSRLSDKIRWRYVRWFMNDRSWSDVYQRYTKHLDDRIQSDTWTDREDMLLQLAVEEYGIVKWEKVSQVVHTRHGHQCREKYFKGESTSRPWIHEEDERLLDAVNRFGEDCWSFISEAVTFRSRRECKKRYKDLKESTLEAKLHRVDVHEVKDEKNLEDDTENMLESLSEEQRTVLKGAISAVCRDSSLSNTGTPFMQLIRDHLSINNDFLSDEATLIVKRHYDKALRDHLGLLPLIKGNKQILSRPQRKIVHLAYRGYTKNKDRSKFLQEALISLVRPADDEAMRSSVYAEPYRRRTVDSNLAFITKTLRDEVLDSMEANTELSPLPPFYASVLFERSLREKLSRSSEPNPDLDEDDDPDNIVDIVNESKKDPAYKYLKMQLQRLLFMPMLLERSIENESSWRERTKMRENSKEEMISASIPGTSENNSVSLAESVLHEPTQSATEHFVTLMRNASIEWNANYKTRHQKRLAYNAKRKLGEHRGKVKKSRRTISSSSEEEESDMSEESSEEELNLSSGTDDSDELSSEDELCDEDKWSQSPETEDSGGDDSAMDVDDKDEKSSTEYEL